MNQSGFRVEDCPELPRCEPGEWCWHRWTRDLQRQAEADGTIALFIMCALAGFARVNCVGDRGEWYEIGNTAQHELWRRGYKAWDSWRMR